MLSGETWQSTYTSGLVAWLGAQELLGRQSGLLLGYAGLACELPRRKGNVLSPVALICASPELAMSPTNDLTRENTLPSEPMVPGARV